MAKELYWCDVLTGGGSGALDALDGANLEDGEAAIVVLSTGTLIYRLNATLSGTEDGYRIINPDTNPGTKSWELKEVLSPASPRQNALINGDFMIWQRQVTFSVAGYTADRWYWVEGSAGAATVTRDTDVPTVAQSGHKSNYSLKIDCTTADGSMDAGDYATVLQKIEGYNFIPFVGQKATLSFWVKSTKTGTFCVAFQNSGQDRSYVAEYTISSSNTWEKKKITLDFDYSGGTWNYTNGVGITVVFTLMGGSTYQTTAGSWQTGNYFSTSNQANGFDNTANNFLLSQVQLELGGIASPFQHRSIQEEFALCQRYYETSLKLGLYPGVDSPANCSCATSSTGTTQAIIPFVYKVAKREDPTVTFYNAAGTSGAITFATAGSINVSSISQPNPQGLGRHVVLASDPGNNDRGYFDWASDAEL